MLPWRTQDVRDVKIMGHLLRKAAGIERFGERLCVLKVADLEGWAT